MLRTLTDDRAAPLRSPRLLRRRPPPLRRARSWSSPRPAFRRSSPRCSLYVADKEGFFKKYGANVEVRPFDTGAAAARAVVAGRHRFRRCRRRRW